MSVLVGILSVALVLVVVVVVHELGHFVLAKWSGIRVDEFAVGFGPRIAMRRRGETVYSLRALPLGGYVRMAGMSELEPDSGAGERAFIRASKPRRAATLVAGVVSNFVFAGICFTVLAVFPTASQIVSTGPAYAAGLRDGDRILTLGGTTIDHSTVTRVFDGLFSATEATRGRATALTYRTPSGRVRTTTVTPALVLGVDSPKLEAAGLPAGNDVITTVNGRPVGTGTPAEVLGNGGTVTVGGHGLDASGRTKTFSNVTISGVRNATSAALTSLQAGWKLGIGPDVDGAPLLPAIASGFGNGDPGLNRPGLWGTLYGSVTGLAHVVSTPGSGGLTGPNGVSGPVGIAVATNQAAQQGPLSLLALIGLISASLGLINVLPVPFLDGGRLAFLAIEAVRRRRFEPRVEAVATAIGLAVLIIFVVYVTIGDVGRLT